MSKFPADLRYTTSHEWARLDGQVATVGISWFAQDSLGDVVHVELPKKGAKVSKGQSVAEIESVKAVSEIYSPVSGTSVESNNGLDGDEENVNTTPYGAGWLFKGQISDASELASLMDVHAYEAHVAAESH